MASESKPECLFNPIATLFGICKKQDDKVRKAQCVQRGVACRPGVRRRPVIVAGSWILTALSRSGRTAPLLRVSLHLILQYGISCSLPVRDSRLHLGSRSSTFTMTSPLAADSRVIGPSASPMDHPMAVSGRRGTAPPLSNRERLMASAWQHWQLVAGV